MLVRGKATADAGILAAVMLLYGVCTGDGICAVNLTILGLVTYLETEREACWVLDKDRAEDDDCAELVSSRSG